MTPEFHDALIKSIVDISKEEEINIFDIIKMMISETNWVLSPGERNHGGKSVAKYVQKYINGAYSYPIYVQIPQIGTPKEKSKEMYRDCLVKIHGYLNGEWDEIIWFELLTYLIFIQSNCHHKGNPYSATPKLCRNSDSFLNFFYKSKNAFDPWSQWEDKRMRYTKVMDYIQETKTSELRGEWWVKAFEREKRKLLMFETLSTSCRMVSRFTTGWIVRGFNGKGYDVLPQASVVNQLREHYGCPQLCGDYGYGHMSAESNVYKIKDKIEDKIEGKIEDKKEIKSCDLSLVSIGLFTFFTVNIIISRRLKSLS